MNNTNHISAAIPNRENATFMTALMIPTITTIANAKNSTIPTIHSNAVIICIGLYL